MSQLRRTIVAALGPGVVMSCMSSAQIPCSVAEPTVLGRYAMTAKLGWFRNRTGEMLIRSVGPSGWGAIEVKGMPPLQLVDIFVNGDRVTARAAGGGTSARLSITMSGNTYAGDLRAEGRAVAVRGQRITPCGGPTGASVRAVDVPALRRLLNDSIPAWLEQYHSPGLAVAIVDHGAVAWTGTFGVIDVTSGRAVTQTSAFSMGSISKTLTAWAVMTLVQEGKVDLDAPVEQYLEQWHLPPSAFEMEGVTVRRLLMHSAGINVPSALGISLGARLPTLIELMNGEVKGFENQRVMVTQEPGTQVRYSGGGYEILQLVVEDVTGERFVDFARRRILEPLGMRASTFEWNDSLAARVATPYREDGTSSFPWLRYPAAGTAGLYSTIDDMAAFILAHFERPGRPAGGGVISPASLQLLMRPDSAAVEYGLGYEIVPMGGRPLPGHSGSNPGWKANVILAPERSFGFVVMTNIEGGGARAAVLRALAAAMRASAGW